MSISPLERIAEAIVDAVPTVLPGVDAGPATVLPRGADPFAGSDRPLLLAATRWTAVSPGGVIVGGTPDALATVIGFELPERPNVSPDDAAQQRRATDEDAADAEDDAGEGAEAAEAKAVPEAEEGAPDGDAADADPDAAADAEEAEAPVPTRRWSDHVADACRDAVAPAGDGFVRALATLVSLPPGAAATQAVLAESDAMVNAAVGPLPDAVVVPLRRDGVEVRLLVVVAGLVTARVAAAAVQVGSASGPGAGPVEEVLDEESHQGASAVAEAIARVAVGGVPLELAAEIGTTRLPLSSVLALREGAVVELSESVDAPVALVAGSTPVAEGTLELDDLGGLVLHVTAIPGRPDLTAGPVLVSDDPEPVGDASSGAVDATEAVDATGAADAAADAAEVDAAVDAAGADDTI